MNVSAMVLIGAMAAGDPLSPEYCASVRASDAQCRIVFDQMAGRDENTPYTRDEAETIMECYRAMEAGPYCERIADLCERVRSHGHDVGNVPSCERWREE